MSEPSSTSRHVLVRFGRDVTDDDLRQLQQTADVLEVRMLPEEVVDEDHVHVHPN